MSPRLRAVATLLALLAAACTDSADPGAAGNGGARAWDLRPQWIPGETIVVRQERWRYGGRGPFPGTAEIENRAETAERSVDVYEVEVLRATGSHLAATERTYRSSYETGEDGLVPTVVSGRKYLVEEPFGKLRIRRIEGDGTEVEPKPEEMDHVGIFELRLAASLVPGEAVPVGASWKPGRSLEALAIRGGTGMRMIARLDRIEEDGDRQTAVVTAETDSRMRISESVQASLTIRETLRIDVVGARFESYRAETDRRRPATRGKPEEWRRTVVTVTLQTE